MNKEELININGIREDLYQAMQIGDITLSSKNSQKLVDFMNYQDKEIERLNNIINELEKYINENYVYDEVGMKIFDASVLQDKLQELKGDDKGRFKRKL